MARLPEFKYMKESTYQAHFQKYTQEYNKLKMEGKLRAGSRQYQFNDFVRNFNDNYEIKVLEGKTPDKYNIYKELAKSSKQYTTKQEKAFRKVWNENLDVLSKIDISQLRSNRAFTEKGFLSARYTESHMNELVYLFDSYNVNWRAQIDT